VSDPRSSARPEDALREQREHLEWAATLRAEDMDGLSAVNLVQRALAVCDIAAVLLAERDEREQALRRITHHLENMADPYNEKLYVVKKWAAEALEIAHARVARGHLAPVRDRERRGSPHRVA
jgi:hypothetical protein